MVVDYGHFGDVVCLDTTYRSNDHGRPFSLFLGINHHKQLVIFGAALLYDETTESFKWLFEAFIKAMSGKMPKTILIDQETAISNAVASVLPETRHRICVWHVFQNALKHLSQVFNCFKSFAKDFSSCLYDQEEEEDFIQAWGSMLEKYNLTENEWLKDLFQEREQWALVYGRDTFSADIRSAQQTVSIDGIILRKYLKIELDLLDFFRHFESLVEDYRYEELKSNFEMSQSIPKLVLPVKMLKQVVDVYTPVIYEMFQKEYVESLDCVVHSCNEMGTTTEYKVTVVEKNHENTVTFNSLNGTILCSCKKFEFIGILCSHALKILDLRNIKVLRSQYILKRWTKNAKSGSIATGNACTAQTDPKFDLSRRYKELCGNFVKIAARAAETEETYTFAANYSEHILHGIEEILKRKIHEEPLGAASNGADALTSQSRH
ncbi:protein FAR1-RELATED SEQUENCE 5-like [Macadamia integrifolia]|uniref:protein FAR1-RELATED SEQUENCE 5-like n=1 Tax=Macadamia integrifolia TaxID=60698 RepID=UPI001C4F202A|nr:protein FAR1-RELATED SEQUENCE 5-like [Macadamia integrifolia]XP_042504356.1 protein FAR1-RELATED SEQUENCE 5-like [Macadamia integrifolia]